MRSSFCLTGVRTTDDVGRLCGSCLFFTWLFFLPQGINFVPSKGKRSTKIGTRKIQTCLMCWDCERVCSQVLHAAGLAEEGGGSSYAVAISRRNSADLDFSGLVGSFQSACLKKGLV